MTPRQPDLADGDLRIRPLRAEDREALYTAASDPLIWAVHPAHDRWQQSVFDRFFDDSLASAGGVAIELGERIVGHSRYDLERVEPGEVEIGWTFLTRDQWGGATNRRVKRLMVSHALQHFDRALFLVGEHNVRSRRAMEKIGSTLIERTHDTILGGQPVRHVIYAIGPAEFVTGLDPT